MKLSYLFRVKEQTNLFDASMQQQWQILESLGRSSWNGALFEKTSKVYWEAADAIFTRKYVMIKLLDQIVTTVFY